MKNSELRKIARESMNGKMTKASLYVALYSLITSFLASTQIAGILLIPLKYGITKMISIFQNGYKVKAIIIQI